MKLTRKKWEDGMLVCVVIESSREWKMDEKERKRTGGSEILIPKPLLDTSVENSNCLSHPCSTLRGK